MSPARVSTACSASSPSARMVIFSPFLASPVIFRTLFAFTSRSPFTITTCEENPFATFTNRAAGRPWIPSSGPTVVSLCAMKNSSHARALYKTRHTSPMIPSLALESGYGACRRRGHEPHVRRDCDELESLQCHARGVQHTVDSFDYLWLFAVHARSVPEALAQIRGPHEHGIQAWNGENLLQVFERFVGFDHGHRYDSLVRVVGVILTAVEDCPARAVAAVALRRVATGPDEGFGFLAGIDHRADHCVATSVEHTHDEAGIVPRHPDHGHGIRRRDSLEHRHEAFIIHGPMLHIYGQAVPSRLCHYLGRERARHVQPPVHSGLTLTPDLSQKVLSHP